MRISTAKQIILAASKANDTVIIEGKHGLGKSNIVQQFAKEHNHEIVELFLSHQEVGDVIGIPTKVEMHGEELTNWTKPIWLQRMVDAAWPKHFEYGTLQFNDKDFKSFVELKLDSPDRGLVISRSNLNNLFMSYYKLMEESLYLVGKQSAVLCSDSRHSVLFLDELNRAPIDVRQSALQLVLEKKIHEHELPYVQGRPSLIVAAINPADQYQVDELDPALLDRFLHITVEANAEDWLDWAREEKINDIITGFITEHPDRLHYQPEDGGFGASPRSWSKLASFVDNFDTTPAELRFQIIKGKIGEFLAAQFYSYYNTYSRVIKLEDVEELVEKRKKTSKNPKVIAKHVAKLIDSQEPIQKSEMAERFYAKYLDSKTEEEALPMLSYFYAINLEIWSSFIKKKKEENLDDVIKLGKLDTLNKKELFTRITSNVKTTDS